MSLYIHPQTQAAMEQWETETAQRHDRSPETTDPKRSCDHDTPGNCHRPDMSTWPMRGINFFLSAQEKEALVLLPAATIALAILLTTAFMIAYGRL